MSQTRIREWYEHWNGQVYVSFSGGKDSTVLLHLVRQMYPDVPAVFVNTGLEYPEVVRHVKSVDNVEIIRPQMNFKKVIDTHGYPVVSKEVAHGVKYARKNDGSKSCLHFTQRFNGTAKGPDGDKSIYCMEKWKFLLNAPFLISAECCGIMKKKPFHLYQKQTGRFPYIGTMAIESRQRETKYLKNGCNAFNQKRPVSNSIAFWTEQDIYRYILQNNLPIAEVYGEIVPVDMFGYELRTTGVDRTGCMFCMFGVHLEKYPNRFQRMKVTHPKLWAYCMDKLGLREVLEYINVPYE